MSETSVKLFLATKMKCAVVSALISIAFVSQPFEPPKKALATKMGIRDHLSLQL